MQIGCIIQARLGSTRLPRKVLAKIGGWPMIKHVRMRAEKIGIPVHVVSPPEDVAEISGAIGNEYNPSDMLKCYLTTAKRLGLDGIMRLTGDCPLLDPAACQRVLRVFESGHYDYVANDVLPTYPDGMGCEIFTREALEYADRNCEPEDREHVTTYLIKHTFGKAHRKFTGLNVRCPIVGIQGLKLSVDTPDDLLRVQMVDAALPADKTYSLQETFDAAIRAGAFP